MKSNINFVLLVIFLLQGCSVDKGVVSNPKTAQILDSLLAKHEFFRMRDLFDKASPQLSTTDRLTYQAFIDNAFNKASASNEAIRQLLSLDETSLSDTVRVKLLLIQRDNYTKLYNYKAASETGATLLEKYAGVMDSLHTKHIRNLDILFSSLANTPPQQSELKADIIIPWKRNTHGLMEIPVRNSLDSYDFIFDTRASVSTITRTYAEKLKLRIIDAPYEESSGITGNTFAAYPAVADSIVIDNLVVRNVIFQVVPDEILSFPSINFRINGIIGFPVIKQWGEVQINKNGTMTIPTIRSKSSLHNLAFDESTTVINLRTDLDTLSFHFDSGATSSLLYSNFLEMFKDHVTSNASIEKTQVGGAGGIKQSEDYVYPIFTVYAGGRKVDLKNVQVLTAPAYPGQKYYGNIGQDLLNQFDEIVLNFDEMFLDLK
ncbi:MAG TPA: retropepsin-like aspartic protease [Cyclobacteriaceae bacterium]|nr:retropepsin-like aspartic protease [Cyclobacteriaceae bacterium]